MWYFAWALGLGFAAALGILNALWFELKPYDKAFDTASQGVSSGASNSTSKETPKNAS